MLKKLIDLIRPTYNETSLFLTLIIIILLFLFDEIFSSKIAQPTIESIKNRPTLIFQTEFFIPLLGILALIFSIFRKKKASSRLKYYMIGFAMMVDLMVSYFSLERIINNSDSKFLLIFPILNLLHFFLIGLLFRKKLIDENVMSDQKTSWTRLLVGVSLVGIIFYICEFKLNLHWTVIFSITLGYATMVNEYLEKLIFNSSKRNSV